MTDTRASTTQFTQSRWAGFALTIAFTTTLAITGCQTVPHKPVTLTKPTASDNRYFDITGKIGLSTAQSTGSAFYQWQQRGDRYHIELSGAFGIGQTVIDGQQGYVTLNSARTGILQAKTPEDLLLKATGWHAPISDLMYWINGQSATAQAITQYDSAQRLIAVQEKGWHAKLSYNGAEAWPNKLLLTESKTNNRVTLLIQERR